MKNITKILALALAALLLLAAGSVALADTSTPSITITPGNTAQDTQSLAITYTYYQILEASIDEDPTVGVDGVQTTQGTAAYYVTTEARATQLTGTGLFNVTKVDGEDKWFVELKDASTTADAIVAALSAASFDKSVFPSSTFDKKTDETAAESGTLAAGYYYIESSLGTKIAVQTLTAVTITEKNEYPTAAKTDDKEGFAAIGDDVSYTITVGIPETVAEKEIVIYDTITKGLTLNTAVTVAGAVADPAYTSATFTENTEYSAADGEKQYTITIPAATVIANKGQTLTFKYTAKVNENAEVLETESNKAHITYDHYTTVEVGEDTDVTVLAIDIQKVDGTDKTTVLAGATFKLYDAETGGVEIPVVLVEAASDANGQISTYRVAVEGETAVEIAAGTARIEGLDNKTYYLEEVTEPTGYNKLNARFAAAASQDTSTAAVDYKIENNKGATLPSTGGIGTTIFYVVGGVLVAAAAVLLITKRRMSSTKD